MSRNASNLYILLTENFFCEQKMETKPGHFKILAFLSRKDGASKGDLVKAVGSAELAIKYRKDLIRWGLIYQDENDRFHLAARSWELLYVYQVLKFFEEVVTKAKGALIVKEQGLSACLRRIGKASCLISSRK